MKANELRIGNYVNIGYGFPTKYNKHKILSICPDDYGISYDDEGDIEYILLESIKPIPLTEEWLLKFGIEKHLDYWYLQLKNKNKFETVYLIQRENIFYYGHGNWSTKLKYVHQLQNLYFALTEEELTIKELIHEN